MRHAINNERDRAVARHVRRGTEGIQRDVGGDHERDLRVVEAQHRAEQAGGRHDGATGHAGGGDHRDAEHEDEADPLEGGHRQALGQDDREREREDLRGRAGQVDRRAQRDGEGSNRVGHAVLLRLTQRHRDGRGRGGRAERRQVGGHHREQRLNGVAAGDDTGEAELGQQDDDLEDQDHDHDAQQGADNGGGLARVGQVQEDTEDVQGQQRDDDRLDEARDDGAELDEALTQDAARHHRQAQADHEGEQQRRHDLQGRRHLDREVGLERTAGLGHRAQLRGGEQAREERGAHQEGQEARKERRAVGDSRRDTQPLSRAASQVGDRGGHQADDDERNREGEELTEDSREGREDTTDFYGDQVVAADADRSKDGREDDRSDHPHEDSGLTQERAHVFHLEIRDDGSPIACPTFTHS